MRIASLGRTVAACTAATLAVVVGSPVVAQTCGTDYMIKDGDSLSDIAARTYGNPSHWTIIFYANQDRLGSNASLLVPGLSIRLPCLSGSPTPPPTDAGVRPQPAPGSAPPPSAAPPTGAPDGGVLISSIVRRMELLTADGYAPYTGRTLEGGGMLTQVLSLAMSDIKAESKGRFDFGISWVNDWAAHLNPLLTTRAFDVGFPWPRPRCEDAAGLSPSSQFRCQKFFFSDPIYEVVTAAFVRSDAAIQSLRTEEVSGKTFCRPTGYPVQDEEFDEGGRGWLKDGKITVLRPATIEECFRLLDARTVDVVAIAELVGRSAAASLGMSSRVRELDTPLGLNAVHVVIAKNHPHARTMLYYLNTGLARLRASGEYDRVVERHLERFWNAQNTPPSGAGTQPARAPAGSSGTPGKAPEKGSGSPAAVTPADVGRPGAAVATTTPR
jgi:polar amino acid transport system substrate-binding protein